MKTVFFLNNKKISKKAAEELLGKEKLNQRIQEAKEYFREDPYTVNAWADGFEIQFQ